MDDIFEDDEFSKLKINVHTSKSVRNRKYFLIPLPFDTDTVMLYIFASVYKCQDLFELDKTYCVENNIKLPIQETVSFIFADKNKLRVFQNIRKTPEQEEIPIILDQFHNCRNNLHRCINATIRAEYANVIIGKV